jgi:hypothetical protein
MSCKNGARDQDKSGHTLDIANCFNVIAFRTSISILAWVKNKVKLSP